MNNNFVADTMAVVLRLERRRMPQRVRAIFEKTELGKSHIFIPAIVLMEIGYLSEKRRIDISLNDVRNYCSTCKTIEVVPMTQEIVEKSFEIDDIPEVHDRIIDGTAYMKLYPLITNDPIISESTCLSVIW